MALQPGQSLGHYRIVRKIGSGGMGVVWSAEDTRLKRTVALKLLPEGTADDERLRKRFEREAQAVAALNHPNIVTIHSVEETDGQLFLTLELIDGESLTRRMKSALPLEEIFALAIPLTNAVAAAHGQGILHRDLKPDNVMVTAGGAVKVLDFGLARFREPVAPLEGGGAREEGLTQENKVTGTAAYMSPEQAEGKALGPESDVFALGIILYQMATGSRPFAGSTAISTISAILKEEPQPVTERNRAMPRQIGRIIRRCLVKDPQRRYASARELHNDLEFLREEMAGVKGDPESLAAGGRIGRGALIASLAGMAIMAVAAAVGWLRPAAEAPAPPAGALVSQQTFYAGVETDPSLSPDGQYLAYSAMSPRGDSDIYLLRVDGRNPINLTEDSDAIDGEPAFSPDGSHIAFRSNRDGGGLYVMGATGETVRRLTDFGFDASWSPDGKRIVFATDQVATPLARSQISTLHVVDVESGEMIGRIYENDAVQPAWSPSGERIAFWTAYVGDTRAGQRDIATVRADGSGLVMVTDDAAVDWKPAWSPDGRHLYFASNRGGSMNLWRIAIDESSGVTVGALQPVTMPSLWSGPFSIAATAGNIAYVARDERAALLSVAFDPAAGEAIGEQTTITRGAVVPFDIDLSPNGKWIAFTSESGQEDIYLVRTDGSDLRKLTDDAYKDRGVSWIDDERLVFYSGRSGSYEIWTMRMDGSGLQQLTETTDASLWFPRFSPDQARLMAHNASGTYFFDLSNRERGGEAGGAGESESGPPERFGLDDAHLVAEVDGSEAVFLGFRWSPDGTRVLGTAEAQIRTIAAIYDERDGSVRNYEPPAEGDVFTGEWFPDGRRFFASVDDSIWVVDSRSGDWKRLPFKSDNVAVERTRDGRMIYYVETTTEADIWIARME